MLLSTIFFQTRRYGCSVLDCRRAIQRPRRGLRHATQRRRLRAESGPTQPTARASVGPSFRRSQGAVLSLVCLMFACGETFDGPRAGCPLSSVAHSTAWCRWLTATAWISAADPGRLCPVRRGRIANFQSSGRRQPAGRAKTSARAADGTPLNQPGAVLYSDERTVG